MTSKIYQLYDYFRSSAAFRVRIGLNLKNIVYEQIPVHLLKNGGEQQTPEYLSINPQGLVPALSQGNKILTQSLAILEYLEEIQPEPSFLPTSPIDRAEVRSLSLLIACDIHPLNNLRILNYLKSTLNVSEEQKQAWYQHWLQLGFEALEQHLGTRQSTGKFCFGDSPSLADICLVPQYYNAKRYHCPMLAFPTIEAIAERCLMLPAFHRALPDNQQDAAHS